MLNIKTQQVIIRRGSDVHQDGMFSYLSPEARVPQDQLRPIRKMVNQALSELSREFQAMYAREGRPSIPPEKLLRALVLQVLYSVRSERLLMEQLDYNLLFRWFVGLSMDDRIWDHSTPADRCIRHYFFCKTTGAPLHPIFFLTSRSATWHETPV